MERDSFADKLIDALMKVQMKQPGGCTDAANLIADQIEATRPAPGEVVADAAPPSSVTGEKPDYVQSPDRAYDTAPSPAMRTPEEIGDEVLDLYFKSFGKEAHYAATMKKWIADAIRQDRLARQPGVVISVELARMILNSLIALAEEFRRQDMSFTADQIATDEVAPLRAAIAAGGGA